jgi:hypothetical protein
MSNKETEKGLPNVKNNVKIERIKPAGADENTEYMYREADSISEFLKILLDKIEKYRDDLELVSCLRILFIKFMEGAKEIAVDDFEGFLDPLNDRFLQQKNRYDDVKVFSKDDFIIGIKKDDLIRKLIKVMRRCEIDISNSIYSSISSSYDIESMANLNIVMKGGDKTKYIYEMKSDEDKWKIRVTNKKNNKVIMLLYDPKADKYTSLDVY